jgi:hypothetical protein
MRGKWSELRVASPWSLPISSILVWNRELLRAGRDVRIVMGTAPENLPIHHFSLPAATAPIQQYPRSPHDDMPLTIL